MLENIDVKYRLEHLYPSLKVLEVLDYADFPLLTLEIDEIGNKYLSYLIRIVDKEEIRAILQISQDRVNCIKSGEMSIIAAFDNAENRSVYVAAFNLDTGSNTSAYLLPSAYFNSLKYIDEEYTYFMEPPHAPTFRPAELIGLAVRKQKLVLDLYLQSSNLISSVKPYAIFNIVVPIVNILKDFLKIDARNQDQHFAFSHFREASLGVTIEINFSPSFFEPNEMEQLSTLMYLLKSETKEDLQQIISRTKSDRHWKPYNSIIKAIIVNRATLNTAYANPLTNEIQFAAIDAPKAKRIAAVLAEEFNNIVDVEQVVGYFLEIDIDVKEPSFKIGIPEDNHTIRGKIDASIVEKIKNTEINIGKRKYLFSVRTVFTPETTTKSELTRHYLVDFSQTD